MKRVKMKLHENSIIMATCFVILAGCSNQFASTVRKVTYPPDFKYTEPADLKSDMHKLAQQMQMLDLALLTQQDETQVADEMRRQKVLTALQNMSKIGTKLKGGDAGANHPFMQNYMRDFVASVDEARTAASLEQPRYYLAGKISGGCTSCHKVNR